VSRDRSGNITRSVDRTFTTKSGAGTDTSGSDPSGIKVPASIDATGATDVGSALQRFVAGVPDGSTIVFPAGATYRVGRGLYLSGRRDLVLRGNGATIRTTGPGDMIVSSTIVITGSQRITVRDLVLVGSNAQAGTASAFGGGEAQMGVAIYASTDIELDRVTMRRFLGDCVYVSADTSSRVPSERVRIHDSSCTLNGRTGVSIAASRQVTIERTRFDQLAMFVVNIEADYAWEVTTDVMIRDNTIGSYGLTDRYTSWVLAAEGAVGSTVRRVSLIGNTVSGGRAGYDGKALGLNVTVRDRGPREDFVVRDNVATITVAGPVMQFLGVDGVTVTGNTQPLRSGRLATFTGSTDVTFTP